MYCAHTSTVRSLSFCDKASSGFPSYFSILLSRSPPEASFLLPSRQWLEFLEALIHSHGLRCHGVRVTPTFPSSAQRFPEPGLGSECLLDSSAHTTSMTQLDLHILPSLVLSSDLTPQSCLSLRFILFLHPHHSLPDGCVLLILPPNLCLHHVLLCILQPSFLFLLPSALCWVTPAPAY